MIVRRGLTGDARGIATAHVASWQAAYRGIVPDGYLAHLSVAEREARWQEILGRGEADTYVACESNRTLGFISFGACRDQEAEPRMGEIYALYVEPSRWSTGIGRRLLEQALREISRLGSNRCSVWVLDENHRAIRFYERAGFSRSEGKPVNVEIGGANLAEVRYEAAVAQ